VGWIHVEDVNQVGKELPLEVPQPPAVGSELGPVTCPDIEVPAFYRKTLWRDGYGV